MKVLQINNYHRVRGGSDRYYLDLARGLSERNIDVYCVSTQHPDNARSPKLAWSIPSFNIEKPRPRDVAHAVYSKAVARSLKRCIQYYKPDLAHLHIYEGQFSPSILPVLNNHRIPVIQTIHDYKPVCPVGTLWDGVRVCTRCFSGHFYQCVVHRCNRGKLARSAVSGIQGYVGRMFGAIDNVDQFIAVSNRQKNLLVRGGVPTNRVSVVHNFTSASPKLFKPPRPTRKARPRITFVGRLETIKGIWVLLEAATKCPDIIIEMIGTGDEAVRVKKYVESKGLENVRLTGRLGADRLRKKIASATAVVLPSICEETFGLTILEAWACGVPVIASDIGGMSEVVQHGSDGFLVSPENVNELIEAIVSVSNSPRRARLMGRNGQLRVIEEFGVNDHINKIIRIYEICLQ